MMSLLTYTIYITRIIKQDIQWEINVYREKSNASFGEDLSKAVGTWEPDLGLITNFWLWLWLQLLN